MTDANIILPQGCACVNVGMGTYANQIELPTPRHMLHLGSVGCLTFYPTTCIDRCIAPLVQELWDRGVITTGCCCGHNIIHGYVGILNP